MLYRDPRCVFVADTLGQAGVVAGWLQDHGIAVEVMNQLTMGGLASAQYTPATGIEVWIVDPAQAPEAVRLLGEHALELLARKQAGRPLEVVCDECGEVSTFPAEQAGSVQHCPHCSAYLDVEAEEGTGQPQEPGGPEGGEGRGPGTDAITDRGRWDVTRP
jgi:hypothetical protein